MCNEEGRKQQGKYSSKQQKYEKWSSYQEMSSCLDGLEM